jgi:hypothetical protein
MINPCLRFAFLHVSCKVFAGSEFYCNILKHQNEIYRVNKYNGCDTFVSFHLQYEYVKNT